MQCTTRCDTHLGGVIEGDPKAHAAFRRGVEEGTVLVTADLAAHEGCLEDVHGLGQRGEAQTQRATHVQMRERVGVGTG